MKNSEWNNPSTGTPKHGHQDLRLTSLSGGHVGTRDRLANVVDEQALPKGMDFIFSVINDFRLDRRSGRRGLYLPV